MIDYASLNGLFVLVNVKSYNVILIGKGIDQIERMIELRKLSEPNLCHLKN